MVWCIRWYIMKHTDINLIWLEIKKKGDITVGMMELINNVVCGTKLRSGSRSSPCPSRPWPAPGALLGVGAVDCGGSWSTAHAGCGFGQLVLLALYLLYSIFCRFPHQGVPWTTLEHNKGASLQTIFSSSSADTFPWTTTASFSSGRF